MSKELIVRLRNPAYTGLGDIAADLIEAQAKEVEELKAQLKAQRPYNGRAMSVQECDEQNNKLRAALVEASGAIELLYAWANNWDSEFMNDPDWKHRDVQVIQETLTRCKELIK